MEILKKENPRFQLIFYVHGYSSCKSIIDIRHNDQDGMIDVERRPNNYRI